MQKDPLFFTGTLDNYGEQRNLFTLRPDAGGAQHKFGRAYNLTSSPKQGSSGSQQKYMEVFYHGYGRKNQYDVR